MPGLDIAARYVPAEGDLGGDWYDVFSLPGDRIGVVMGDVVGHGLGAAVVMGRLKSALRAYALVCDTPSEVLSLLDRKISHFEPGVLATVIYGVTEEPYDEITFSTAGHWPPIVVDASGAPRQPLAPQGLMLGVDPGRGRRDFTVALPPLATLCLFTDGLLKTPAHRARRRRRPHRRGHRSGRPERVHGRYRRRRRRRHRRRLARGDRRLRRRRPAGGAPHPHVTGRCVSSRTRRSRTRRSPGSRPRLLAGTGATRTGQLFTAPSARGRGGMGGGGPVDAVAGDGIHLEGRPAHRRRTPNGTCRI